MAVATCFQSLTTAQILRKALPIEMQDASGHRIQLMRDKERNLEKLISPSGRTITFKYDFANRVVEAADDAGNIRKYSYNSSGHLETVSDGSRLLYRLSTNR